MLTKLLLLVTIGIFAPPFLWLACGSQLVYASRLARRQRLIQRAHRLIHTHASSNQTKPRG
ncbi:exported protein of unknown function [Candidatus Nitrospira inopinata]|uniref:Uncharacterized protein n=1 Tax=Candidatus Nitrospira inopinata TaxID=1715989 RepID=A0A0S4KVV9_9BACT|nr:exported protein of unknown function [Candidatus Nitrospira inopinata]